LKQTTQLKDSMPLPLNLICILRDKFVVRKKWGREMRNER
jgi:hypothetical protein